MNEATANESQLKQVEAALSAEARIGWQASGAAVAMRNGRLVLKGELADLPAKRLAVQTAESAWSGVRVEDLLSVPPGEPMADGEVLDAYTHLLLRQVDLQNSTIHRHNRGRSELIHQAPDDPGSANGGQWVSGDIDFWVTDGVINLNGKVISLSHRRIAEVLGWWVPGCRAVANNLIVVPPEADSDDEINDAVQLVLEMDPLLHRQQIQVTTNCSIVSLEGVVTHPSDVHMAEYDAWCVSGVRDVVSRLTIG